MKRKYFLMLLSVANILLLSAQNISGIINIYTPVTAIGNCNLSVQSSSGFSVGDKVLIIQMKGATIDITNTLAFGTILNYNDCGNYEFNTVAAINGNSIILQFTLLKTYTISDLVQLIRIPVYNSATITGTLNAQPWNGSTGGVLAFIDLGNTTFNADIDVQGDGFRGTPSQTTGWIGCSVNFIEPQSGIESLKGEGIVVLGPTHTKGTGSPANGGGGGITDNGGGGASNFGAGGIGGKDGWQPTICGLEAQGGNPLTYSNVQNKIFMGGAGGDAQRSEGPGTNMGVSGAGIIIIRTNSIIGNNRNILAQGRSAPVTAQDGGGGGGAGGTILIECTNYIGTLNINTSGGKGGDANVYTAVKCSGGGGGGGGVLWVSLAAVPANILYVSAGGGLGLSQPPAIDGVPGQMGGTVTNLVIPESTIPTIPVVTAFTGIATICVGDITTISASGGTTYTWSTGSGNSSIIVSPSATTTYSVTVSNGFCSANASVTVTVLPTPNAAISGNTVICAGDTTTFTATGGGTYSWSTGATTAAINATVAGTYSVMVTVGSCTDVASIPLIVNPLPPANAGVNITIAQGQSATLTASGGTSYQWNNGATTGSSISVSPSVTTEYCVVVTDSNGCIDSACVIVFVIEPIDCTTGELYLPNAFSPNKDGENDVFQIYYADMRCIKTLKLIIYDRWGEKVFETTNATFQWEGSSKGKIMNSSVFVYYLRVTLISGAEIIRKGNVSLIR